MTGSQQSSISYQLFSDYHSHPQGHRVQSYSQELLQPWIDSARARGLNDVAFTDRDRFHAGVNFDEIEKLRAANSDVKIRAGIELDNDPQTSAAGRQWVEKNWDKLDFVLGSVHYLDDPTQMFDSVPDGAGQFVGRSIDEIYEDYFHRVRNVAATGLIDCLSHLDLIKIHGHRPDRKSTRLNSSHSQISYAVFCLKKKKNESMLVVLSFIKQLLTFNPCT